MKKILKKSAAALAALTLTAALAGCGSSASSAATSTDTAASTAETSGENELEKVKAAGKLVIGVEGTYPPFTYHDDNGELTGLDVELGKALAEKLGVEVEFQEAAWDSLLIGIDTGRFDTVINSVSITDERAEKYDFSDPYYYEARRVVVRADDDSINGPEQVKQKPGGFYRLPGTQQTMLYSYTLNIDKAQARRMCPAIRICLGAKHSTTHADGGDGMDGIHGTFLLSSLFMLPVRIHWLYHTPITYYVNILVGK